MTDRLSIHRCANYLRVAPRTVAKWIDAGRLPAARDEGGNRYVTAADLAAFIEEYGLALPAELAALARGEGE